MTLAAWLHSLSPYAVRISSDFGIRWYGLSYALGFALGWMLLRFLCKRHACRIPLERVGDAIVTVVVGVVVGGRLGYVLIYEPHLLSEFSNDAPWWGLLAINRGGMASHGGMIGVIIAAFYIARGFKNPTGERIGKAPVLHVLDTMALIAPAGLGLGRIANFVNGELLGKIVADPGKPAPWWAVKFPQEVLSAPMSQGGHRPELTADQQTALNAIVAPFKLASMPFGDAYERVLTRLQAGDSAIAKALDPLISARHPSQLYQAFAEGLVLFVVLWFIARKPRTPGVIGGWFLIGYGVMRIITELYRLPDAQLAVQRFYGLSRGQWLSVGMVAAGTVMLPIVLKRGGKKLGGWWAQSASPELRP